MNFKRPIMVATLAASLQFSTGSQFLNYSFALETPQAIIENWIANSTGSQMLSVKHDGVSHDASSGLTVVNNLEIAFKLDASQFDPNSKTKGGITYSFKMPSVTFANLREDGSYYQADRISADKVNLVFDIDGGSEISQSSSGSYSGMEFNNLRWHKLPEFPKIDENTKNPANLVYSLIEPLTDFSMDSAQIGEMSLVTKDEAAGLNMDVRYGAFTMGKVDRGNMSEMTMGGITMDISERSGPQVKVKMGPFTASDYNYGDLIRMFGPDQAVPAGSERPYRTLIGKSGFSGLTADIEGGKGTFSVGEIRMDDIGMRPFDRPILDDIDSFVEKATLKNETMDEKEIIKLVLDLYGAFRLGTFSVKDIKVDVPSESVKGEFGEFLISDLSANGLGELRYGGINFAAKDGGKPIAFNLDLFSIAKIGFPSLDAIMKIADNPSNMDETKLALAVMPTVGSLQYSGLNVIVPDKGQVSLADAKIEMSGHIGPIPTKIVSSTTDLKVPASVLEPEQQAMMAAFGYDMIDLDSSLNLEWTEADGTLSLGSSVDLNNEGAMRIEAAVAGVPRSVFEDPESAQSALLSLSVKSAYAEIDDNSLIERVLNFAAKQQGTDVGSLKAQAIGILPIVMAQLKNPAFTNKVTDAVQKFLNGDPAGRGKLVFSLNPTSPVSVIQLMGLSQSNPGDLIDLLNAQISAN